MLGDYPQLWIVFFHDFPEKKQRKLPRFSTEPCLNRPARLGRNHCSLRASDVAAQAAGARDLKVSWKIPELNGGLVCWGNHVYIYNIYIEEIYIYIEDIYI